MANLDRNFDIVNPITNEKGEEIKKALEELEGINHVMINFYENKVNVGYTPGITNIQTIKEKIEDQGVDVSDKGDD